MNRVYLIVDDESVYVVAESIDEALDKWRSRVTDGEGDDDLEPRNLYCLGEVLL